MARYCGAVCRFCRREGEKLFLKGERCYTSKCAIERREGGPGQHGKRRQAYSNYKIQFREKQKTKRIYNLLEEQFKSYYHRAAKTKGVTGSQMLIILECRLDTIVHKLGFAGSRKQARQLVTHGHILVNGKEVNIPSYLLNSGDSVEVKEKSKKNVIVIGAMEAAVSRIIPEWLSLDKGEAKGKILALPKREQLAQNMNEQLVVELYSR